MKIRMTRPILISALVVGVLGGVFFGLFSYGGHVWHKHFFYAVFLGLVVMGVILPPYSAKDIGRRLVVGLGIVIVFAIIEATAACFHTDIPSSRTNFGKKLLYHLEFGPK